MSMFKQTLFVPALAGVLGMAELQDMIDHSRLFYCRDYTCVDVRTQEVIELDRHGPSAKGYVVDFTKEYTPEQIREAAPHILKYYREGVQ